MIKMSRKIETETTVIAKRAANTMCSAALATHTTVLSVSMKATTKFVSDFSDTSEFPTSWKGRFFKRLDVAPLTKN